jgi:DNA (cytosine-5)-methyltransferase 1
LAFSEIEDFPRAVLAHHYPDVPCHGDFTVLRDQPWIVDADVLVGGTPCQAFSVAGLRNSLSDERGNLSLEFVRLADAIDDVRKLADKDPAIIVWENVPGVLSVKDNAFGCFLAGLAGDVDPYVPPRGKWTNAGVVAGPQRTVAWRVLDAQYFGLAQRRRRVFVVASARDGFDPAAVLLEFEGVRRDSPPRRETGQAASGGASSRAGERSHWDGDFPHPTLNQSAKSSGGVGASNQELFSQRGAYLAPSKWPADIAPTLNAHFGEKQGLEDQHALGGAGLFVPMAVPLQEVGKRTGVSTDDPRAGIGIGQDGDPMFTLQAGAQHGVATVEPYTLAIRGRGDTHNLEARQDGLANALLTPNGGRAGIGVGAVAAGMAVRRLTPVECERLQGFPDGYTNIPWRGKPEAPDGPRYKSLGNSMAVPVMRWIGERIANALA